MADFAHNPFPIDRIRGDFPILREQIHGRPVIYLDNGASTQKPLQVIEAESNYYSHDNANIHRAVHTLSQRATQHYEDAREKIRRFINARDHREVIFTRGTTEGLNLLASCLGRSRLGSGDEILLTELEHHSNIVPWQLAAESVGASVVAAPINDAGEVILDEFAKRLNTRTKIVSVSWVSNALGTINPIAEMIRLTRRHAPSAVFVVDAAQWVAHGKTDVQAVDCDFLVFSGHKMFGPTGIGVLYGRRKLLEELPPYMGGGDMIETVSFEKTTYAPLPNKFEAGTPNIAGVVGLAAAVDYINSVGLDAIMAYEQELLDYATRQISTVPRLRVVGTAKHKATVISFVLEGMSALDVGVELDARAIAVRTGHHCCMPLMQRLEIPGTARASFSMYNTKAEVDALVGSLKEIVRDNPPKSGSAVPDSPLEITFPRSPASTPDEVARQFVEDFALLAGREERTQYVLDLGANLPHNFVALERLTTQLPGCMSRVYLIGRRAQDAPDRFEFVADSDAAIVRGEIALLERLFSGQRAADILAFDLDTFFRAIGLEHFLTVQRRTGLASMIKRIRQLAAEIATS